MTFQGHSKVKDIQFNVLEAQPYLTSPIFDDDETQLLYSLRTRTSDLFKLNQYGGKVHCPLSCWGDDETANEDTRQHILSCSKLKLTSEDVATEEVKYEHLFRTTAQQKEVTVLYKRLLAKNQILQSNPPGGKLDLSIAVL